MQLKNDLWNFALSFYRSPEVETLCLELQAQHGLSINRVLFACWASLEAIVLDQSDFAGAARDWQQQVTHPVRSARYAARPSKTETPDCYKKLRDAELACEQVELALLYNSVADRETGVYSVELLRKNLATYLASAEVVPDKMLQERMYELEQSVSIFRLG